MAEHPAADRLIRPTEQAKIIGVTSTDSVRYHARVDPTFPPEILPGWRDKLALIAWKQGTPQPEPPDVSDLLDYEQQGEVLGISRGGAAGYASRRSDYPAPILGHYRTKEQLEDFQENRPRTEGRPKKNPQTAYAVVLEVGQLPKRTGVGDEGYEAACEMIQGNDGKGTLFERPEKSGKSTGQAWAKSSRRVKRQTSP